MRIFFSVLLKSLEWICLNLLEKLVFSPSLSSNFVEFGVVRIFLTFGLKVMLKYLLLEEKNVWGAIALLIVAIGVIGR